MALHINGSDRAFAALEERIIVYSLLFSQDLKQLKCGAVNAPACSLKSGEIPVDN